METPTQHQQQQRAVAEIATVATTNNPIVIAFFEGLTEVDMFLRGLVWIFASAAAFGDTHNIFI